MHKPAYLHHLQHLAIWLTILNPISKPAPREEIISLYIPIWSLIEFELNLACPLAIGIKIHCCLN